MPFGLTAPTISLWAFSMSAVLLQKKIPSLPTPPAGLATTGHLLRFVAHSRSSSTLPDLICSAAGTPHLRSWSCIAALSMRWIGGGHPHSLGEVLRQLHAHV